MADLTADKFVKAEITRFDAMNTLTKTIFLVLSMGGVVLFIFYMFGWNIKGYVLMTNAYYYLLYSVYAFCVFVAMPATKRKIDRARVPWYDYIFGIVCFGIPLYFFFHAQSITEIGWVPPPSVHYTVLAVIWGALAIEACRRIAGIPLVIICLISVVYPLIAEHMPGVLFGISSSFLDVMAVYAFSISGALGLTAQVMGEILIGFLLFAGMLMASGAGTFFLNFALSIMGRFRGGPAKVAVLSSGLFGSMSGSGISNVVATGAITIPTMKRIGYPPHYAGAIEACASTGGVIMPPVMGAVAFIMAIITGIEYATIIIAAFIPALLYYFGLLMQVDAYAGRVGLRGLDKKDIPSLKKTLKEGWPFVTVLLFLIVGLLYFRWGPLAPIYASGLMFVLAFTNKKTMMTPRRIVETATVIGSLITQTMAILLPVGFIFVGLVSTGLSGAFTTELARLGGDNLIPMLLIGVGACYVMGLVGMGGLAYIFLAVTLAPAIIKASGLNELAVHLFLVCYAIMGSITPPVGVTGFVAAALAGAPPMKTLVTSMRLGVVLVFLPFFFVLNPALVLQGDIIDTVYLGLLCIVGIIILTGGLEGFLVGVGKLRLWHRPLLVAGGFLIALPGWQTTIGGAILTALVIAIILITRKATAVKLITSE